MLNNSPLSQILNFDSINTYLFIVACTLLVLLPRTFKGHKRKLPPGPYGLPIVGYLPFLGKEPFQCLHKLREKYGSVFGQYLGRTYVVILADFEAVKEAFVKFETTDRPESVFNFIHGGFGFSSVNGEEWMEQRKHSLKAMRDLGFGKSDWELLVQAEVEDVVKKVHDQRGHPFNFTKILTASVANNIITLLFGKRMPLDEEAVEFLNNTVTGVGQFAAQAGLRSSFPGLIDTLADWGFTSYAANKKHAVNFGNFIQKLVKFHKENPCNDHRDNYVDDYLKKIKENEKCNLNNTFNENNLYGNLNALFFASTEPTRTSINWLLLSMASDLEVQRRVQDELDAFLGGDGKTIQWQDRTAVPYTYAVVMEGQRWRTLVPLNTPRRANADVKILNYDIAKGTTIIANYWGLHNDPKYWKDPEKFLPERFLSADGKKVNLKPESYVPFSYGKRSCPGEIVGMMEILFYFAALMQRFTVLPPEGKTVNLQGTLGMTYQPVPQEIRFVSRK